MKKAAIATLFILIVMLGVTFSSCGEKVTLSSSTISLTMLTQTDGSITQEIDFSLQTEKLNELNVNANLQKEIKNNFLAALNALKNEFYISFLLVYSLNPDPNMQIGENVIINGPFLDEEQDLAGFNIVYKSISVLQYYQTGQRAEDNQLLGQSIPIKFLTHVESEGKFPFAAEYTNKMGDKLTVGQRYLSIYRNCFNKTLANDICDQLGSPQLVYDYATPYSNIRTNADLTVKNGIIYHNVWLSDKDNFVDKKIKLSSTVVYAGWWYLSLLVGAICLCAIGLIVIKVKK